MCQVILLIACSAKKWPLRPRVRVPARNLYAGTLTRLALELAAVKGWEPLILSAKYGIIKPTERIEWYDQKLTEPYDGPWPEGSGWFVGSRLYFGKAPERFQRLLPPGLMIGQQLKYLKDLIRETKGDHCYPSLGIRLRSPGFGT